MILRVTTSLLLAMATVPAGAFAQAPGGEAAPAEAAADAHAILEALELPAIIDVMAREGTEYGEVLAESVFGGSPVPAAWTERVAGIYDPDRMEAEVLASLAESLAGEDTAAMLAFLETGPGQSMAALELAAREAMLDEDVEEAAKEAAAVAIADDDPRIDLLRRYAEANDLVETNVVGALNTNYAYFMGLMDGGAMEGDLSESDVLADVWAQEPQIRADTTEWVYSFLLMAYAPVSDADLEALISFSETEPGQALNRAVFEAFDGVLEDISRSLGLASARYLTTQEL